MSISVGGSASGWMATTDAAFVTFSAASGVGSGSLTLTYAANGTTEARSGMVTISTTGGTPVTETLTLTQVGATSHTISLSTTTDGVVLGAESGGTIPISLPADGTEAVLTVALGIATGFTAEEASDTEDFVTHSVSGDVLTIFYSANPGTTPRRATITLSTEGPGASITRTLSLTQRSTAAPTLSLTTSPSELTSLAADGGTIEVSISVGGSASGWMATTAADFVTFSAASGVGSGSLTLTYAANATTEARTAMVTLSTTGDEGTAATETLSLTQAGADLASIFGISHSKGGLVLYPNPASGLLHISGLQGRALVRISTLGGKIVRKAPVSASANSIDVSDLRGGTYVVAIESGEAALSKRLVIIK